MYTDFHDQNGNPVSTATVLAAIKQPIIKHTVGFVLYYPNVWSPFAHFDEDDFIRDSLIITNSCGSDGIKLGSVNIGMLKVTVKNEKVSTFQNPSALINAWLSPQYRLTIDENTTVTVMSECYWVKEVEQLTEGVRLICYDGMCKLDTPFSGALSGTPYQILTEASTACGVRVQSAQADIEALPNGQRTFTLHSDNDCKTWRDVLSYLSALMGCFVTFGRWEYQVLQMPGIEVRPFGGGAAGACDTVTDYHRYNGSKFSLWDTAYAEFTLKSYALEDPNDPDSKTKKDFTYSDATVSTEGQTYDLGYNPFLQPSTPEADLTADQIAILHDLLVQMAKYQYTPMQISLPVGFIYDLGDVIKCSGGYANTGFAGGATDDAYGVILNESYTYGREYRIKSLDSHAGKGRQVALRLRDLPVGSLVKDPNTTYGGDIIWRVLEHGHTGDPEGSTTLDARDIISMKAFDAKEVADDSGHWRDNYGNARYKYSNILQWLNSEASAGNWYTAQHQYDNPPDSANVRAWDTPVNPYYHEPGFLANFSADFRAILQTVTKPTGICDQDGGGTENVPSKLFLLSATELGHTYYNQYVEGTAYALYSQTNATDPKLKKIANARAKGNATQWRVGATAQWCLRTPRKDVPYRIAVVRDDGVVVTGGIEAFDGMYIGISPALCLPQNIRVSSTPDTDGAYILQF